MKTSAHITLTTATHESRLEKEALSLIEDGIVARVIVYARHGEGLPAWEEKGPGLIIRRLSLWTAALPKSMVFQAIKLLEYFLRVWLHMRTVRPAYISVHSYALLPLGALGKWTTPARLVYDTHELETEVEGMAGIRKRAAKWIERRFIRCADLVFVVSEPIVDWYAETYLGVDPVLVMNCPPLDALADSDLFRDTYDLASDTSIVLYQGLLGPGRGLEEIVELFDNDPPEDSVLVLMGYGALEEMLHERAAANPRIFLHPAVPRQDLPRYSASADIGLCLIQPTCLSYEYALPNKLFEYLSQGLVVIMSDLPAMRRFHVANRMGELVPPNDPSALSTTLARAVAASRVRDRVAINAISLNYNWDNEGQKMIEAYRVLEMSKS